MLCPGPMIASEDGKPTPNLRLAADEWPIARPTYTYVVPIRLALALAFKQKVPELTITYEDAAEVYPRQSFQGRALLPSASRGRASSWAAQAQGLCATLITQGDPVSLELTD